MEYELCHWGIKGMKWGVRRYQRKDGTLTNAGKRRLARETAKANEEARTLKNRKATQAKIDKLEAKKKANEELKNELKKRGGDESDADGRNSRDQANDIIEQKKAQIIQSRSAKALYDNADLFDNAELNAAYNRLNLERNIKNLVPQETSKGQSFADKTIKAFETTKNLLDKGSAVYESTQKVAKLFGKKLPEIPDWASKDARKLTDDELSKAVTRLKNEKLFKTYVDGVNEEKAKVKAEKTKMEAWAEPEPVNEPNRSNTYRWKNDKTVAKGESTVSDIIKGLPSGTTVSDKSTTVLVSVGKPVLADIIDRSGNIIGTTDAYLDE